MIAFPTITPGTRLTGALPTLEPEGSALLANPATAIAAASLPTATPNYARCPAPNPDATFSQTTGRSLSSEISAFLSGGGSADALENGLQAAGLLGEGGTVNGVTDLTGEGVPEVVVSAILPEQGGTLMIFTCEDGRYSLSYQNVLGGEAPQLISVEDINYDNQPELLFAARQCDPVDELCAYRTGVSTWDANTGAFVTLLATAPDGDALPRTADLDNDNVLEVITQQEARGTSATGPIRTGIQIYDWNGTQYVLSFAQPDRIRYVIQAVHQADRAFRQENMDEAARLYQFIIETDELGYWFGGDERDILRSYALYRLLLTYTFAENGDALSAYEAARQAYPDPATAPVYTLLTEAFWGGVQETNNLNAGCQRVLAVIDERPEAIGLLNRYGSRNPTYTAQQLCPF